MWLNFEITAFWTRVKASCGFKKIVKVTCGFNDKLANSWVKTHGSKAIVLSVVL